MNPFNAPTGDYERHLYGEYAPRFSARRVAVHSHTNYGTMASLGWVELPWASGPFPIRFFSLLMYKIKFTIGAVPWTGSPLFKIEVGGEHVYPFGDWEACNPGTWLSFGCLSMSVRTGDSCVIYGRSSSSSDNTGQTLMAEVNSVRLMEGLGE